MRSLSRPLVSYRFIDTRLVAGVILLGFSMASFSEMHYTVAETNAGKRGMVFDLWPAAINDIHRTERC